MAQTGSRDRQRLGALASIAALRKEADLELLARASARLTAAITERDDHDRALRAEVAAAGLAGDFAALTVLDAHVVFAERARERLEQAIADLGRERERVRDRCRVSFGRWSVMNELQATAQAGRPTPHQ